VSHRHLSSSYTKLLYDIHEAKGVPCEDHPDLFFPEDISDVDQKRLAIKSAKLMCNECPIKLQCFEYALETDQKHGIWGGTLPHER
jgi:WhiB family transcriptional regulator, redox-sensing transcriptional regulator